MLMAAILLKEHELLSFEFYIGAALIIVVLFINGWLNQGIKAISG
jgi:hypothetical protein